MDSIQSSGYPGDSAILQKVRDIREMALLEGMLKTPTLNIYQTFYARAGAQWKGLGQSKAVLFCLLVIVISMIQLKATRSKEVQQ